MVNSCMLSSWPTSFCLCLICNFASQRLYTVAGSSGLYQVTYLSYTLQSMGQADALGFNDVSSTVSIGLSTWPRIACFCVCLLHLRTNRSWYNSVAVCGVNCQTNEDRLNFNTDLSPMQSRDKCPNTVSRMFQPTSYEAEVLPHKAYKSTEGSGLLQAMSFPQHQWSPVLTGLDLALMLSLIQTCLVTCLSEDYASLILEGYKRHSGSSSTQLFINQSNTCNYHYHP